MPNRYGNIKMPPVQRYTAEEIASKRTSYGMIVDKNDADSISHQAAGISYDNGVISIPDDMKTKTILSKEIGGKNLLFITMQDANKREHIVSVDVDNPEQVQIRVGGKNHDIAGLIATSEHRLEHYKYRTTQNGRSVITETNMLDNAMRAVSVAHNEALKSYMKTQDDLPRDHSPASQVARNEFLDNNDIARGPNQADAYDNDVAKFKAAQDERITKINAEIEAAEAARKSEQMERAMKLVREAEARVKAQNTRQSSGYSNPSRSAPQRPSRGDTLSEAILRMDDNKDGRVSKLEAQLASPAERVNVLRQMKDRNGDGKFNAWDDVNFKQLRGGKVGYSNAISSLDHIADAAIASGELRAPTTPKVEPEGSGVGEIKFKR